MPKRKTSTGPQPLNCSDGAQMLIDQMKMHPEEFRGYDSKFRDLLEAAQRTAYQPATVNSAYQMSTRDAAALMAAAETHLFEVWLAAAVLTKIMTPKEEPVTLNTTHRVQGKSAWQGVVGNSTINTPQYTEQARYKLEIEEQYDLAHAQRNTKTGWTRR